MNDMENNFKSDIIGYLEFVSQLNNNQPDQNAKILLDNVQQTLTYYNNTNEAKMTLHKVLFKVWNRREFYHMDFDVPNFERGVQTLEYLEVVLSLDMEQLAIMQLFSIPPEASILVIQQLLSCNKNTRFTHDILIAFFEIMSNIEMDSDFKNAKAIAIEYLSDHRIEQNSLFIIICKLSDRLDYYDQLIKLIKRKSNDAIINIYTISKGIEKVIDLLSIAVIHGYKEKSNLVGKKLLNITKKLQSVDLKLEGVNIQNSFYSLSKTANDQLEIKDIQHDYCSIKVKSKRDIQNTIISDWETTTNNCTSKQDFHQEAFIVICHHLKMNSFPFQPVDITEIIDQQHKRDKDDMNSLQSLSQLIHASSSQCPALTESQLWCISMLISKNGVWQSVLKVIVQFMDLWIGLIQESRTGDIFASLITNQNMIPTLYKNLLKHVRHYDKLQKPVIFNMIRSISALLEQCLDCCSICEMQSLRNHAFFKKYSEQDITLPILGSIEFWNISFDNEITKIGNQITTYDGIEYSSKINNDVLTRKINLLSFIWPYRVIRELFLLCVYNKNQHQVIIPLLHQLGRLCQLKTNASSDSLLLMVLKAFFQNRDRKTIEEHMGNITQFVKGCCHMEFNFDYPLILAPTSLVELSSTALLNIREFFQDCILQNLECFYTLTTSDMDENQRYLNMSIFRTSLTLLYSLFDQITEQNYSALVHNAKKDGLPIILYSQPETLAKYLTDMLYLRNGTRNDVPRGFRLQDWEYALAVLRKLSDITRYMLHSSYEFLPFIRFLESLKDQDWKVQLLWYDFSSHIPELKHPILVPDSLFRLTGEMNYLFMSDHVTLNDPLVGWCYLFEACKLSRTVIDTLFINHEKWMYHLILLWKHPNEDTIIGPCFRQVLHPQLSFSVASEYSILLVDFIEGLASTFDIQKTIHDYSQSDPELLKMISKLSEQDIKQFFQVLYIIRLLSDESELCKGKEVDAESTYYIASLIKALQGLTNWGSLSKANYFKSQPPYSQIKSILIPVNTSTKHLNNTFQSNPLILDENINSGTGTATDQLEGITHAYYPLLDEKSLSSRTLSLLTLCFLCQVCGKFEAVETRDIIRRLLLQIVEGFVDKESEQHFQRLIKQQPKNRIAKWKKAKHAKIAMNLRPALSKDEENLLTYYLTPLYDSEKNGILQALNLTVSPLSHTKKSGSMLLYFS